MKKQKDKYNRYKTETIICAFEMIEHEFTEISDFIESTEHGIQSREYAFEHIDVFHVNQMRALFSLKQYYLLMLKTGFLEYKPDEE